MDIVDKIIREVAKVNRADSPQIDSLQGLPTLVEERAMKILGQIKRTNKSHVAWELSKFLAQTRCGLIADKDNVVPITK